MAVRLEAALGLLADLRLDWPSACPMLYRSTSSPRPALHSSSPALAPARTTDLLASAGQPNGARAARRLSGKGVIVLTTQAASPGIRRRLAAVLGTAALLMGLSLSFAGRVGAANPPGWTKINACVHNTNYSVQIRFSRYSQASLCPPGYTQLRGTSGPARPARPARRDPRRLWR